MITETINFKQEDWELFCNINTLSQKSGVSKENILKLVAKELTDNSLDTGSEVEVNYSYPPGSESFNPGCFYVKDKGSGIEGTDEEIANLFKVNRPLISSKRLRLPYRGALGNGLRVISGALVSLGGFIYVSTKGRVLKITPDDKGEVSYQRLDDYTGEGTRIEVNINGKDFSKDTLLWAYQAIEITQGNNYYSGNTSPYWYDSDSFYSLVRSAPDELTVRNFISRFDGCSGTKAGNISKDYQNRFINTLERKEAQNLLSKAIEIAKEVTPVRLGEVGELEGSIAYYKEGGVFNINPGIGTIDAKIPFIIEAWNFNDNRVSQIFVNRTPITGEVSFNYYQSKDLYINGCGIKYLKQKFKEYPHIWINIITPYMPITTDGKEPDLSYIKDTIKNIIEKLSKRTNKIFTPVISEKKRTQKEIINHYLNKAINKASGNGEYRYSLRQLYYAVRPYLIEELSREPTYDNFTTVITDIESQKGEDLPNIYRDTRGTLLHPHLKDTIPLGTLNIERYKRPEYLFNKILYIEKEGFFELLKDDNWSEKNDCALISSKGYSSRATKDLIDYLASTNEDIEFFCVHDADPAGTMIYQTLQEETRAREARKIKIIDLGLYPDEAQSMNLQIEKTNKKNPQTVANGYKKWESWLQNNRVELNSMDSPTFIKWITKKIKDNSSNKKVIPPEPILKSELLSKSREELKKNLRGIIEKRLNIDELINKEFERLEPSLLDKVERSFNLSQGIEEILLLKPENSWREPLERFVINIVNEIGELINE